MTSHFYNRILNKIESYLTSSKTMSPHSPNKFKRSLSFSPDLLSSNSPRKVSSTTARLKRLASSIENLNPSKSLLRSSSSLSSNRVKPELLEERLREEKAKNSQYLTQISSLKLRIEDLNSQLHHNSHNSCMCHVAVNFNAKMDSLIKENEDLRRFKENVFKISKRYDDINESVLLSLKEMDQLFTRMNEAKGGVSYLKQMQMQTMESSINTFENVINTLVDMIKSKQDEYNYLIEIREKDVNQLYHDRERQEDYIKQLEEKIHHHLQHLGDHYCHNCLKSSNVCTCYHHKHQSSPGKQYISQRLKQSNSFM